MDKNEEEQKEMPEDPVDKPTGEEKIQDKAEEAVEEKPIKEPENDNQKESLKEESDKDDKQEKPTPDEKPAETSQKTEEPEKSEKAEITAETKKQEKNQDTAKDEKPVDKKEVKSAKAKEKPKKKDEKDADFQYIVRLSNTDIDGDKKLVYGLTSIKGIGIHIANLVVEKTGLDPTVKIGKLKEKDIQKLQESIDSVAKNAPSWMLNHRKDAETGNDIHLIGPDIELRLRDEINIMKKIRSYRGIRHERGLTVRGQRTRANNRKGLTLGVSKKRVQSGK